MSNQNAQNGYKRYKLVPALLGGCSFIQVIAFAGLQLN